MIKKLTSIQGRADGHAASCTFELDSTAIGPSQMTAPPSETHGGTAVTMPQQPPETRLPGQGHVDPRANLNSLGYNDGQPRYVNHWNQYREMGSSS